MAVTATNVADLAEPEGCFHCGEPLPPAPARVLFDAVPRSFCCNGCSMAARWIRDAHLEDFYQLRSAPSVRVDADVDDFGTWDRADVQQQHVREVHGGREIVLLTDGMRCAACAWLIDRALTREPGVIEVAANAVTGRIRLVWDPAHVQLSAALRRLASLGYRPYLASGEGRERARRIERNRSLLRLGIAGLAAMQVMMFSEALYLDTSGQMSLATRDFFRWIAFLVSTPVVFYAGWPFLAGSWRELQHRRLGMDTLVATSTLLAYFASLIETLRGGAHVWYDAAVMFVFLLLAARMLEQRVRNIAIAQIDALARARPALATREGSDGSREVVPVTALVVGDIACIAAGDTAPADGFLLDGHARFEEALLTGESSPVAKTARDEIYAGTVCLERPVRMRITHVGLETRLSQVERLVEEAQAHRPALARYADRVAGWFVLGLFVITACVYAAWRIHDPTRAFEVMLSLLVISCPCALSLSIPAALAAAHSALARLGVLVTRADALDTLARVTDIVFDKTGTLSDGALTMGEVELRGDMTREAALGIAAALEQGSLHPIGKAFVACGGAEQATDIEEHAGQGIEARVGEHRWRLGRAQFAARENSDDDAVWLGDGSTASARFTLVERVRLDAQTSVDALKALSLDVHLSSGDARRNVARLAESVGIVATASRQSPQDKLAHVRTLQAGGRIVAMAGDGLNDAPVLAGADVSIAMGDGAALAQRSADIVMTGPSLTRIPAAIALARRTQRVIRQNLAWAVGYNVLALPLAAAGLVTPWLAALSMAVSSLTVTLNALRLTRIRSS